MSTYGIIILLIMLTITAVAVSEFFFILTEKDHN